jgi:phosphatidylglycerophosphate synthase
MEQQPNQPFQRRSIPALIFKTASAEAHSVAGVKLAERWRRGLSQWSASAQLCSEGSDLRLRLDRDGPTVLAWGAWAIDPLALEEIMDHVHNGCAADEVLSFVAPGLSAAPLICLGARAAQIIADRNDGAFPLDSDLFLCGLPKEEMLKVRQIKLPGGYWAAVADERSAKRAVWRILKRLQWRPGGLVAKYLNRPISIRLSYLLMNTPVTPNQTTLFAFLLGAIGIVSLFCGGYWNIVFGAALLQLNSIIDGIDGELARVRIQTTEFGAYLDSICDEILNTLLFVAIGYNISADTKMSCFFYIGLFTGAMALAYAMVHWHCKWKHGLGFYWWFEADKPRKQVQRSTSFFSYFKKLFWKESYLFLFLVAALLNYYQLLLWIAVPAAIAVMILFFIHFVVKRARW